MAANVQQLQDENYSLRMQLSKLQVALKHSASKLQQEADANKRLQAEVQCLRTQLAEFQRGRHANTANPSQLLPYGGAEILTIPTAAHEQEGWPSPLPFGVKAQPSTSVPAWRGGQAAGRRDAGMRMSQEDVAFIEHEMQALRQQLAETRSKLHISEGGGAIHGMHAGSTHPPPPQRASWAGATPHIHATHHWEGMAGSGSSLGQAGGGGGALLESPLRLDGMLDAMEGLRAQNSRLQQQVATMAAKGGGMRNSMEPVNRRNYKTGTGGQENKTRSKKMSGSERTAVQFLHLGMPTVGIYRPA